LGGEGGGGKGGGKKGKREKKKIAAIRHLKEARVAPGHEGGKKGEGREDNAGYFRTEAHLIPPEKEGEKEGDAHTPSPTQQEIKKINRKGWDTNIISTRLFERPEHKKGKGPGLFSGRSSLKKKKETKDPPPAFLRKGGDGRGLGGKGKRRGGGGVSQPSPRLLFPWPLLGVQEKKKKGEGGGDSFVLSFIRRKR